MPLHSRIPLYLSVSQVAVLDDLVHPSDETGVRSAGLSRSGRSESVAVFSLESEPVQVATREGIGGLCLLQRHVSGRHVHGGHFADQA